MTAANLSLKRMGVMNITPDSFSDGGELSTELAFAQRIEQFARFEAIDLGAESTAPHNQAISYVQEWERIRDVLPLIKNFPGTLSFDTYHPETVEEILRFYQDHHLTQPLMWNDVSGKFDGAVSEFLSFSRHFHYVFCHNRAPSRELTQQHMKYVSEDLQLENYFAGHAHPQVIFDPGLGFSKSFEQNWWIMEHMAEIQKSIPHHRWLLGFSRKSFLRKKYNLSLEQKAELDSVHELEWQKLLPQLQGEVWIRTHRPDLINFHSESRRDLFPQNK